MSNPEFVNIDLNSLARINTASVKAVQKGKCLDVYVRPIDFFTTTITGGLCDDHWPLKILVFEAWALDNLKIPKSQKTNDLYRFVWYNQKIFFIHLFDHFYWKTWKLFFQENKEQLTIAIGMFKFTQLRIYCKNSCILFDIWRRLHASKKEVA